MENFIVSARKYRPASFDTVVGQGSITVTLKNAIKTNHLAHAYLFCGPRGVGKTTCARIFAKTINCMNLNENLEACNECESCKSFSESRSFNIHELDAASNNSVEDIRNLTDQVRIPPQIGKYSIYIIDEVHMLSTSAFNAFLKTLEEPPKHAIFILATTEKHKIIPTILSRCQIFDFNRMRVEDIVVHLEEIANKEDISAEAEALNVIAQKADGAMRDALSLFDQVVSFAAGKTVTYKLAIDNLNVLDYDYYFKLTDAFLLGNAYEALLIFDDILKHGFDAHHFITGLSSHFRDLLVCTDAQTIELMEVGAGIKLKYKSQATSCAFQFLYEALNISNTCDLSYKGSRNPRLHVELALLKVCNLKQMIQQNQVEKVQTAATVVNPLNPQTQIQSKENQSNVPVSNTSQGKDTQLGVSLKSLINNQNKNTNETQKTVISQPIENNNQRKEVFTLELLRSKWKAYADSLAKESPRISATLNTCIPNITTDFLVEVKVENAIQEESINKVKPELLGFLKKHLQNEEIDLKIIIEEKKTEKRIYTDGDKFNFLNSKNPKLSSLKQQFNLDFI